MTASYAPLPEEALTRLDAEAAAFVATVREIVAGPAAEGLEQEASRMSSVATQAVFRQLALAYVTREAHVIGGVLFGLGYTMGSLEEEAARGLAISAAASGFNDGLRAGSMIHTPAGSA